MQQRRVEGTMDMAEREYFGPRRIAAKAPAAEEKPVIRPAASPAVRPQTETVRGQQAKTVHRLQTGAMHRPQVETVRGQQDMATSPAPAGKRPGPEGTNPSPYAFGTIPENTSLRVRGHAKGNHAVRWVKKSRSYVEMASMYGLMRITPVAPDIIRVSFVKGVTEKIAATGWMAKAEEAFSWSARESKSVVEIAAGEITVRVDKRSGAVSFWNRENQLLLAENAAEPRVIGEEGSWVFFDWDKKERIKAKGMLDTDFLDVTLNARYISFGGKSIECRLCCRTAAMASLRRQKIRCCSAILRRTGNISTRKARDSSTTILSAGRSRRMSSHVIKGYRKNLRLHFTKTS